MSDRAHAIVISNNKNITIRTRHGGESLLWHIQRVLPNLTKHEEHIHSSEFTIKLFMCISQHADADQKHENFYIGVAENWFDDRPTVWVNFDTETIIIDDSPYSFKDFIAMDLDTEKLSMLGW